MGSRRAIPAAHFRGSGMGTALLTAHSLLAQMLVPVVGAAVVAAAVSVAGVAASSAPAHASTSGSVLILSTSVSGGTSSVEAQQAAALNLSVTVATPSTWDAMTESQFQSYSAIVIGDPSTTSCASAVPSDALSTAGTWGPAINGNVAVLGTAPALGGGATLVRDAIAYSAGGDGGTTGLYLSLNCEYSAASAGTAVPLLASVDGGGFTVTGQGSACSQGTVNTWQALAYSQFNGLTSSNLGPWSSPACSVEETFNAWPAGLSGVAYDSAASPATFTASDGSTGQAYLVAGAKVSSATAGLAPSSGGQVPAGTISGGDGNLAAPAVNQESAGGVNTENGDYSTSNTDVSVPTFGPSLDFTRTYDAQAAQQQTQTGVPGAMGYGWTDNWASSLSSVSPVPGDVYSLDGLATPDGNGGPATGGPLDYPDMSILNNGNVYISDTAGNRIEEIAGANGTQWGIPMSTGNMYTIAGSPTGAFGGSANGTPDEAGVNGATLSSLLDHPEGLAFDPAGDMYIADTGNNRVVEIPVTAGTQWGITGMTANDLYTMAGNQAGAAGHSGDGTTSWSAFLDQPVGLDFGPSQSSDLYIADAGNNRIQEVPAENGGQWGQTSMTAGDMYTVAGSGAGTPGASPDGTPAENANGLGAASLLDGPEGLTFSSGGNMYIADTTNSRIIEIPAANGSQWGITSMTVDDLYTVAGSQSGTAGHSGDNGPARSAFLDLPVSVQAFNGQQLYISDAGNNRIQEVARTAHTEWTIPMTANDVYTIAGSAAGTAGFSGDGGTAVSALLNNPGQVALDGSLNMYIPDTNNNREREVSANTADISEVAGDGQTLASMGDGGPAIDGELFHPAGQAEDASGNIYIADQDNNRIQEIAAASHTQWGTAMTAGDVYTIAGSKYGLGGYSGDSGPASSALLSAPAGIAVDAAGDVFIADQGNNRIREINAATGNISTIAGNGTAGFSGNGGPAGSAELEAPQSVAVDAKGDLFIADNLSNEVREVFAAGGQAFGHAMTAGDIYVLAGSTSGIAGTTGDGGPASSSLLNQPRGVALDTAGDLYIADSFNNRVQEIPVTTGAQFGQQMTKNDTYTIAGSAAGNLGSSGDGGPATSALLQRPIGLAVDNSGDLFIADAKNNRVQEVPAANGTQWGTSMTAADMYTVAGSAAGTKGESGDGGPATSALMSFITGISADSQGNLYITDWAGNHLREVPAATAQTIQPAPSTLSAYYPAPGSTVFGTTYPGGITATEPGGAQVTFYTKTGGSCAPYKAAGQYCVLPEDIGASLTFSAVTANYTFTPQPGVSYTYDSGGNLISQSDASQDVLNISYRSPAPGSGNCPAAANWCETITSASGRALTLGYSAANLVTSVTDPMSRRWTYAYNASSQLTTVTDPMGNVTSYSYGAGTTGNPLNVGNLITITDPNEQTGGPDAGASTTIAYNTAGQVTSQTDPMGYTTTYTWTGFNPATGNGITTVTDPGGNKTVYDYVQGTLAAQSAWTGTTKTSEQDFIPDQTATSGDDSAGTQLDTTTADGNGKVASISYDPAGNAESVTGLAPDGRMVTTTAQSTALNDAACTTNAGATSTCSQSPGPPAVQPAQVVTPPASAPPPGVTWRLYDNNGNQIYTSNAVYEPGSQTPAFVQTSYQLFNGNSVTLPGSRNAVTCTASAPSATLPCATIDANGTVTQLTYDPQGDLLSSSKPDGNGSEIATTKYAYDGSGAASDGDLVSQTSPDGNLPGANKGDFTTVTTYNLDGDPTQVSVGGGTGHTVTPRVTTYGYDADGNQTTEVSPRGFTTTTTYNADDQAALTKDPLGNVQLTCYDGDGNVTQTVPPAGVAAGNLTAASCPSSYPAGYNPQTSKLAPDSTMTTFDVNGQSTEIYSPAPAGQSGYETTAYTYDPDGNVLTITSPPAATGGQNQVTTETYNAAGLLASETTGSGTLAASTVSYCYDPNGYTTSVVYADGNTNGTAPCDTNPSYPGIVDPTAYQQQGNNQTIYKYDSSGDLVSATTPATAADPTGGTTTATYDAAGNMLTSTDPNGVKTTWTYTPSDQPASISYSNSSAHFVTYGYDADGNVASMSDGTGSSAYVYDPFGELTSATNGAGNTVAYSYNPDGENTGVTYPLPASATWATTDTISYGYDHADNLTSATDFNGRQISITPTADGLTGSETLGSTGDTITDTYDPTGSPSSIELKNSTSTLLKFAYSYNPDSALLKETDTPASPQEPAVYGYDAQGRVSSMTPGTGTTLSYTYDASGNPTTLPSGAAGNYDYAGELASSALGGATTTFTYDADGHRLSSKQSGTTTSAATWNGAGELASYTSPATAMTTASYDGNGLRASETSATAQSFTWNTATAIPELLMDSTDAYVNIPGGDVTEQVNLSTGTPVYLLADAIGSIRGVVSASGALTASTSYDAWGNPLTAGGLTSYTPLGYAGGYTDPDGLIYLINRYYDPQTGQFLSVDPQLSETQSPYGYAEDDPVDNADPTGANPWVRTQSHNFDTTSATITVGACLALGNDANIGGNFCISGVKVIHSAHGQFHYEAFWLKNGSQRYLDGIKGWFRECWATLTGTDCSKGESLPFFNFWLTPLNHPSRILWRRHTPPDQHYGVTKLSTPVMNPHPTYWGVPFPKDAVYHAQLWAYSEQKSTLFPVNGAGGSFPLLT
jgi:RHS repeat-associated protein